MTLSVLCVLRSGGDYDAHWVRKLRDGVARNLSIPHRFACLTDVPVPCEHIRLRHDWPGWWSKIELFRPGVIEGPTLYLDLDTVITGALDRLADLPYAFAMLRGFGRKHYVGSGVMWFRRPFFHVYENFLTRGPERVMAEYASNPGSPGPGRHGAYKAARGDQAWIFDEMGGQAIPRLTDDLPGMIRLYGRGVGREVPEGCSVVCFKGRLKPPDARGTGWLERCWS